MEIFGISYFITYSDPLQEISFPRRGEIVVSQRVRQLKACFSDVLCGDAIGMVTKARNLS